MFKPVRTTNLNNGTVQPHGIASVVQRKVTQRSRAVISHRAMPGPLLPGKIEPVATTGGVVTRRARPQHRRASRNG